VHGPQYQSVEIIVIDFTLPTTFKVFCIETNDFALSGVVPMVARRVVTTRVSTRSATKDPTGTSSNEF
jgi:hypothetical protein